MNDDLNKLAERLDNVTGQVAAMTLAIRALLTTHHDKKQVAARFCDEFEKAFAKVLPNKFPEGFVDGLQTVREMFLKS